VYTAAFERITLHDQNKVQEKTMTIYVASCIYDDQLYEWFYEGHQSHKASWEMDVASRNLIQSMGVYVHRSTPKTVNVKVERLFVDKGDLRRQVCVTETRDLPFLALTSDEYEQEIAALLDGLPEKKAAFVRNKAYEGHHSDGYEAVLDAADNLLEDMRAAGLLE
jgi:hypothetical protein